MKRVILFFIITCISVLCYAQPRWYPNAYSQYNEGTYIAGTASDNVRAEAEHKALANLSNQIKVRVQDEEFNIFNYTETEYGFTQDRDIKLNISLNSSIELINARMIVELQKGSYYALALIEVTRFVHDLSDLIEENERMVDGLIRNAEIAHGSLISINYWRKAYLLAHETEKANSIRRILSSRGASFTPLKHSSTGIMNSLERFSANLAVSVNVVGDDKGRITSAFNEVITSRGFRTGIVQNHYNRFADDDSPPNQYVLNAEFKTENERNRGSDWLFVQATLTWTLADPDGKILLSSDGAIVERGGSRSLDRAREAAVYEIEESIKETGFSAKFDGYLTQ